jgi:hypothetical protein
VPAPDYPFNILPYIYLVLLAIGIAWYLLTRGRRSGGAGLPEPAPEERPVES